MDCKEQLSEYAHEAWSGWMKYLFEQTIVDLEGFTVIPTESVERWKRQMNTPYADLPESEKNSDRLEADKMLAIIIGKRKTTPETPVAVVEPDPVKCPMCHEPYPDGCEQTNAISVYGKCIPCLINAELDNGEDWDLEKVKMTPEQMDNWKQRFPATGRR